MRLRSCRVARRIALQLMGQALARCVNADHSDGQGGSAALRVRTRRVPRRLAPENLPHGTRLQSMLSRAVELYRQDKSMGISPIWDMRSGARVALPAGAAPIRSGQVDERVRARRELPGCGFRLPDVG